MPQCLVIVANEIEPEVKPEHDLVERSKPQQRKNISQLLLEFEETTGAVFNPFHSIGLRKMST